MKTTSYENSKKLAEIGFKAETEKAFDNKGTPISCHKKICILREKSSNPEIYGLPAYDLETILEALPKFINCNDYEYCLTFWLARHLYYELVGNRENLKENIDVFTFDVEKDEKESLADTAARLLILLYEKGMVNFN
jgi:hypothetical protein